MDQQLDLLMGREPQQRKDDRQPAPREDYEVLEPYVPLALLFWRATTVMLRPAMGGAPYALDWLQIEALARQTGMPLPLGEWAVDTLEAMAGAACKILREQAEKD